MAETKKQKLYTIKDVSEETDIHPQTLRNWEKEGLLDPLRVAGNQRIYTQEDLDRIKHIMDLKEQGFQIKGILNVLKGNIKATTVRRGPGRPPKYMTANAPLEQAVVEQDKYEIEELEEKPIQELTKIGQEMGVRYFRQMLKDELVEAIANPEKRDILSEQAKERTKERYGGKVYGARRRELETTREEFAEEIAPSNENQQEEDSNPEVMVDAIINHEYEHADKSNEKSDLIQEILQLSGSGKTPKEIAELLIKGE